MVIKGDIAAVASDSGLMGLAAFALRRLLPHLNGRVAEDVAEFVNHPDRPLDQARASTGIKARGDA